jgi:hypothetical protein
MSYTDPDSPPVRDLERVLHRLASRGVRRVRRDEEADAFEQQLATDAGLAETLATTAVPTPRLPAPNPAQGSSGLGPPPMSPADEFNAFLTEHLSTLRPMAR